MPYIIALSALPVMMKAAKVDARRCTGATWWWRWSRCSTASTPSTPPARTRCMGGMLVMAIGYVIWGFIAPRFAPGLAAPVHSLTRPDRRDRHRRVERSRTMQRAGSMTASKCRARLASLAVAALAIVPPAFAQKPTAAQPAAASRRRQHAGPDPAVRHDHARLSRRRAAVLLRDESGKAAGYSVALCQNVADAVKAELGLADADRRVGAGDGRGSLPRGAAGQGRPALRRRHQRRWRGGRRSPSRSRSSRAASARCCGRDAPARLRGGPERTQGGDAADLAGVAGRRCCRRRPSRSSPARRPRPG